jgi:hypothetical protein
LHYSRLWGNGRLYKRSPALRAGAHRRRCFETAISTGFAVHVRKYTDGRIRTRCSRSVKPPSSIMAIRTETDGDGLLVFLLISSLGSDSIKTLRKSTLLYKRFR